MKMVSHHFGKRPVLIELANEDFNLYIIGDISSNKVNMLKINLNHPAMINVEDLEGRTATLKTITNNGELSINHGNFMMPCFFEDGQYQIILEIKNDCKYNISHGGVDISDGFQVIGKSYIGLIDFSSDIGYTTIEIYRDKKKTNELTLEVFPSKLDYYKDYRELILEINEEISALAFKLLDKTYLRGQLRDTEHQTNTEFLNILKVIFDGLESALKRIVNNFKHKVITNERLVYIHKAKKVSKKSKNYIRKNTDILLESERGILNINGSSYYPEKVIEEKKITTIDIFENRFVKYMIRKIIRRLKSIEKHLSNQVERERTTLDFVRSKISLLERYINNNFNEIGELTGKKSMSLVFQMAPGYKEMYRKYVMLNKGLDLGDDLFKLTPKKLYTLYEMWCYIKIHKILFDLGYEVEEYGILEYKDNGMYLSLLQDSQAKMIYKGPKNKLELWYNKSYSLPTIDQRPDTVLHIKNLSGKDKRTYIFDAKYRITVDNDGVVGPEVEDINVMHRYRDAIVAEITNNFQYKYETFGAYVMFPYADEDKFKNHKFFKSIEKVNIGAFPMLPGSTKLLTQHLEYLVNQSEIEASSDRVILDVYDDYAKYKLENIMVVNVKDKLHFKKYMEHRFYHIPAKRLSNVRLGVEYLAFYQSKKSFGDQGGIRYFAKIKDIVRYKRKDCTEIPARRGSKEEIYLRFNLYDIDEVSHIEPIQAGTQIVSYTTLYLLENAVNMHELKLGSNLEIEVYKILKKIASENNWSIRKENNKYLLGKNDVEILDHKQIRVNGQITSLGKIERLFIREDTKPGDI